MFSLWQRCAYDVAECCILRCVVGSHMMHAVMCYHVFE